VSAEQMVYLVLAIAGAVGGAYWRFSSLVASVKDELAAHRLHTAETYVTKAGMQEQTASLMKAIEGVGSRLDARLDGVNDRLDRLYESKTPARRS